MPAQCRSSPGKGKSAWCLGEAASDGRDLFDLYVAYGGKPFESVSRANRAQLIQSGQCDFRRNALQASFQDHFDHAQQECPVRFRQRCDMAGGTSGCFGAARVDDDKLRSGPHAVLEPPPTVGHLAAPVELADGWICADQQSKIAGVDIRYQRQSFQTEHRVAGDMLGIVVDRLDAIYLMRVHGVEKSEVPGRSTGTEAHRVAQVASHSILTVLRDNGLQASGYVVHCLLIACFDKAGSNALHRSADTPGAGRNFMRLLPLHAEIAPRVGVLLVRPDRDNLVISGCDFQPAQLLANQAVGIYRALQPHVRHDRFKSDIWS